MSLFAIGIPGPTELVVVLVIFLITFVIPSTVVAFVAWNLGRSPIAWFFISIVATPIIAAVALVALGRGRTEEPH